MTAWNANCVYFLVHTYYAYALLIHLRSFLGKLLTVDITASSGSEVVGSQKRLALGSALELVHHRVIQNVAVPAWINQWVGKVVLHLIWIAFEESILISLWVPEAGDEDVHVVLRYASILDEVLDIGVLVAHLCCPLDELLLHGSEVLISLLAYWAVALH